jgi:NAD(P)H dehydrogenase (quinone)
MTNIAVVYYSATGHVYQMAEAVSKGTEDAGAEVRLRRVAELTPEEVIRRQDAWLEHYERTVPRVSLRQAVTHMAPPIQPEPATR